VCEQKQKRDKVKKEGKERVTSDIMMLQQPDKSFKTFIACEGISKEELMASELKMSYQHIGKPLPVVCISDGARSIKNECRAVFGQHVRHILD